MVKYIIPEVYTYLIGASVLSFTLPLCFCVAWKRACIIKTQETKKAAGKPAQTFKRSFSTTSDNDNELNQTRLKEAEDAAIMSKMFEKMGKPNKALEIDKCIHTLFKSDGEYSWGDGFNSSEIRSLGPKDLEVVVSTMIASARRWDALFRSDPNKEDTRKRAILTCMNSLSIFKYSPARKLLKDRSVVFPGTA